jgi:hypothetical protein
MNARLFVVRSLFAALLLGACQSPNPGRVAPDAEVVADLGADAAPETCTEGAVCDDADPCTTDDRCRAGRCEGTARDCSDADPCTTDTCDLATGECGHAPAPGAPEGPPGDPTCADGVDQDCDGDTDAVDLDCRACEAAADCPMTDPCITVKCEAGRCVSTPTDEGQSCDAGDVCREKGRCVGGRCEAPEKACPAPDAPCMRAVCLPESGTCGAEPVEDATPCDDGDACTGGDVCAAGVCTGAPTQCGALTDACVTGLCDPETGACAAIARADGAPCGGDDLCHPAGTCVAGRCDAQPLDCAALDGTCRVGVCDPATGGCSALAAPEGTLCDDGDPCTFQDTCGAAGCAGMALDCSVLDSACQVGRCDPGSGACVAEAALNGTPCSDGVRCTTDDTCREGMCGGVAITCPEGADPCAVPACDEGTGACVPTPVADGAPCDDADRCTAGDVCAGGLCVATPAVCEGPGPDACFAGACDPGNGACIFERVLRAEPEGEPGSPTCADGTDDDCDGLVDLDDPDCRTCAADADCTAADPCAAFACVEGRCVTDRAAREGQACDDGNPCTTGDACAAGACRAAPLDCGAFDDACSAGRCDPEAGGCVTEPRPDGARCEDGDACTAGDVCTGGLCAGVAVNCTGLDGECVLGRCAPESGACVPTPRGDGAPCSDADPCTGADACVGEQCAGQPTACEAGPCEVGTCDAATGACHVSPAGDGSACDDGDPCTEADACRAGACVGAPLDCGGLNGPCVAGVCDAATGGCRAIPVADQTPCDDGSLCTADEVCNAGVCGGRQPDCSALDDTCSVGACDPATGRCAAVPAPDGGPCDDADLCTNNDTCSAGRCAGDSVDCSPLSTLCTLGRCAPESGACVTEPINDGSGCDDGNACTSDDVCGAGRCAGAGQDCSAFTGPCTVGQCDAQGNCGAVPVSDGVPCVTADLCLEGGTCAAGVCQAAPRDCSALDGPCAVGTCDPRNGACVAEPIADATPCDDADVCTVSEVCSGGRCEGAARDCRAFDGVCTIGACDSARAEGCFAQPRGDGTACASGDLCVVTEACQGDRCVGAPKACPPPPAGTCRVAVCDPTTGACGVADAPDGTGCDDGRYCTTGETCTGGVCGGGGARDCNPAGESCRTGTCDENNDRCVVQNRQNGAGCEDGQYCTTGERCFDGVCRPLAQRSCPDENQGCRVGVCNEGADRCDLQDAFNLKPCLDGDRCTIGDRCEGGRCVPGLRVCN